MYDNKKLNLCYPLRQSATYKVLPWGLGDHFDVCVLKEL